MQRWLAALLALCMVIGGIAIPETAKAATGTTMTLVEASYQNDSTRYLLWLKPDDGRAIVDMGTTSATVVVDGTTYTSATWVAKGSTSYALALPYDIVQGSGTTTNSAVKTHYVTLKAGSTVGDVTVSQDLYFKVVGGYMTGGECYIEQIDSLPDEMFLRNPTYNASQINWYFMFPDKGNATSITNYQVYTDVYVDGIKKEAQWYGGENYWYGLIMNASNLGDSSPSNLSSHHIVLPKGTTVGSMILTRDYHYMTSGSVVKEVTPTDVSLGNTTSYDDTNKQYVINLVPADGRTIFSPALSSKKILINGVENTEGIAGWEKTSDGYSLKINYATLDSEATTAASVGKYKITLPAGTFVGNMMLEKDYHIEVNGTSVKVYSNTVTMTFTKGVAQDANKRYIIYLKPTDGREITGLGTNKSAKVLVDGQSKTATWDDYNTELGYALALTYEQIQNASATANKYVNTHYVTIQAGSTVGDVILKENIYLKVIGGNMTGADNDFHIEQVSELPNEMFLYAVEYNDAQKYFALWFKFPDGRNLANIKKNGAYWNALSTTYIDNSSWTSNWNSGDASYYYGMKLDYIQLNSSYTSYSQVGEHIFRIPAGTRVGDLVVSEDWYYSIKGAKIKKLEPTTVSLGDGSTYDDENKQYVIQIKPDDGRNIIACGRGSTKISVGDTEVAAGISTWEKATDSYTLRINYDTIVSGATTATSVGKHKITLPKGTYVGDMMLEEDYQIEVNGTSVKEYSDTTSTTLSFIDGGYQDQHGRYVVNVKATDVAELELIGNASGTALVNGVETTVGWEGWPTDNTSQTTSYYSITVPYSAIWHSGQTTHGSKQGLSYITIKAGTTIGNITVSEDFHVKIYGGTTTSNDCLIEQVSEVPNYFYAYWNYNSNIVILGFRSNDGVTGTSVSNQNGQVFVDGKSVWGTWSGTGSYYEFTMYHSHFDESSNNYANTHIVRIPAGTIGDMTFSQDVYIKMTSSVREELVPANVSLGADSSYNNTNSQYVIRLKPDDGKTIITPGASSTSVLIDGVEVENAISYWDKGSDNYGACIKYSAIESDATLAADIGVHTITFPAGTYFGNRILTEDFSVCINGESQISTSSPFSLTSSGYQDGQPNNNYRYIFWLKPTDGRDIVSLGSTSATILVDGKKVSNGVSWVDTSATGGYALAVNYSAIESDAVVSTDVGEHIITIPKGTIVGNVAFAEDFMIKINARDISVYKPPVTVSYSSGGYQDGTNGNYRYIFYLKPDDGREIVDVGSPSTTILVDGEEVSSGISWFKDTNTYALCVKYSSIVSDATSHSQIGEHVLTVPAGTKVGDVEFAEDLYIKINNGTITSDLTRITLNCESSETEESNYLIWLKVTGADSDLTDVTNSFIYLDGEKVSGLSYTAKNDDTGRYLGFSLPYSVVQENATSADEVTESHLVKIVKGTLLNDKIVAQDVAIALKGTEVIEVLDADLIVTLSNSDKNATVGKNGLYFNVSPIDELKYSEDMSVEYSFITNGISVDYIGKPELSIAKTSENEYYVDLTDYDVKHDTVITIVGRVQDGDYCVEYTKTSFQYKTSTGWNIYIEPTNTDVTLTNDTINGGADKTGIYVNATSDPLSALVYDANDFFWIDAGDETETPVRHGGVHLNGEALDNVMLEKKWDGYYYINLINQVETLKAGDIITLEGTLFVDNNYVAYHPISFIRNKDGSFSQYDKNAEAVPAETVILNDLYVNLDKQSTYTIPSTPLVNGNEVIIIVNGNETTEYTLTKAGAYRVKRIMENTILADVVSTVGDITYEQNVYMFKTGDANLDASVSAADIVRMKNNMGKTGNLVGGASDLNYDNQANDLDYDSLIDLLLGRITAEEIISIDQSVIIGAISDTHYLANDRDGQNRINTRKALNYYKSQNADVIVFNADITDLGEVGAYEKLVADIKSVYPDEATRPKLIFTGDNHEWYDAWTVNNHKPTATFDETQQRFYDSLSSLRPDCTDNNTHYKVNGYHFIGVSSDDMNGGYALYDDTTVDWIEEKLEAAAADDATGKKPIFLSIHQAPKNTVYGSDGADHFDDSETKLTETLAKYPQLVIITSHTHASLQEEKSIHQGNYTTLNTASMHYVGGAGGTNVSDGLMSEKYQFAQGLLIKTNGNTVDVERCDFYNDEKIKDNWIFETSDSTDDYTKYTDARANDRVAPTFASGASIATKWNSDGTATLTFDAATHDDFVHHYIVKIYKDGSTTPSTYTYSSLFYLGLNNMDKTVEFMVSNLDATKNYRFEIQAVESWGNTSTAISGSLSAK